MPPAPSAYTAAKPAPGSLPRMPYAVVRDVPASWERYPLLAAAIADPVPAELLLHLAGPTDEGFRTIEIWETREAWQRWCDDRPADAFRGPVRRDAEGARRGGDAGCSRESRGAGAMMFALAFARLALAAVFAAAAVAKLAGRERFRETLGTFGVPRPFLTSGVWLIALTELTLAGLLVPSSTGRPGLLAAATLRPSSPPSWRGRLHPESARTAAASAPSRRHRSVGRRLRGTRHWLLWPWPSRLGPPESSDGSKQRRPQARCCWHCKVGSGSSSCAATAARCAGSQSSSRVSTSRRHSRPATRRLCSPCPTWTVNSCRSKASSRSRKRQSCFHKSRLRSLRPRPGRPGRRRAGRRQRRCGRSRAPRRNGVARRGTRGHAALRGDCRADGRARGPPRSRRKPAGCRSRRSRRAPAHCVPSACRRRSGMSESPATPPTTAP